MDYVTEDMAAMSKGEAAVKDMEGAAVAAVCRLYGTPMLALKAVTDIVDGDKATEEEFLSNLHASSAALQAAVSETLSFLDGRSLSDM